MASENKKKNIIEAIATSIEQSPIYTDDPSGGQEILCLL
jgi:hypothetical protein